ncbi:hypothetical protein D3C86_1288040 [compost metagenome]
MNLVTTERIVSAPSGLKATMASRRLRNSGANRRWMALSSSPSTLPRPKPMEARALSAAPALVVMIRMTFLKSTFLPMASVRTPLSITCNRML